MIDAFQPSCPIPIDDHATVQMAHGGGGRLMQHLIEGMFLPAFRQEGFEGVEGVEGVEEDGTLHDSAILEVDGIRLAFTTDSFVVDPLFFPGGDIGKLAIYGTVNDLAMSGARPLVLSAGFVLEEGLPMETLGRVVDSMRRAAEEVGVSIVTGDTKVVDRGKGDGIFINTSGIGRVPVGVQISPARVVPGDSVIVSGDLGRHGIAVMSLREGLRFEGAAPSDCGSLVGLVGAIQDAGIDIHCLRDLTRGGLASALNEIAGAARVMVQLDETSIPVAEPVSGACELLGLDPLYVANEGRLVAFVGAEQSDEAVAIMRSRPESADAAWIGTVTDAHPGIVELRGPLGGRRILDLLSGEQMPRIC